MKRSFAVLLAAAVLGSTLTAQSPAGSALAAIVEAQTGAATTASGNVKTEVRPLEWLRDGSTLTVAAKSSVRLLFATGARYEISGPSTVIVAVNAPRGEKSRIRAIASVAQIPDLPQLKPGEATRAAAVRIRGTRRAAMYPHPYSAVRSDVATLKFRPEIAVSSAVVEVRNLAGEVVHRVNLDDEAVPIPPGVLEPGRRYVWSVEGVGDGGGRWSWQSVFSTLDADQARAHDAFVASAGVAGAGVIAEVERKLGLLSEAAARLRAAAASRPEDVTLRDALDRVADEVFLTVTAMRMDSAPAATAEGGAKPSLVVQLGQADLTAGAWSRDGKRVLIGSRDGAIVLWDARSGRVLRRFEGHSSQVIPSFSPDEKTIVSADSSGSVRLWDAATGRQTHTLDGHRSSVRDAKFSRDGALVLTGSRDTTARLWDAGSAKLLATFRHAEDVGAVAFGAKCLLSAGQTTLYFWRPDGTSCADPVVFRRFAAGDTRLPVRDVALTADGGTLAFMSSEGAQSLVVFWDVASRRELRRVPVQTAFAATIAFTGGDAWLNADLVGIREPGGFVKHSVIEVATGRSIDATPKGETSKTALACGPVSLDGRRVVTAAPEGYVVRDLLTGERGMILTGHSDGLWSAHFSADGKRIFAAGANGMISVWNIETGREENRWRATSKAAYGASPSLSGAYVVTAGQDEFARVFSRATGTETARLKGHTELVKKAAFSPDQRLIITAGGDGTARIWDAVSGTEIQRLTGHLSSVNGAVFLGDGRHAVTASSDQTARLWDIATGKEVRTFRGHERAMMDLARSADSELLITAYSDGASSLWDIATGRELVRYPPRAAAVLSVAISPNGRYVAASGEDRVAVIYDRVSGKVVQLFDGHSGAVRSVEFSPDGRYCLTASADGSIALWDPLSGIEICRLYSFANDTWAVVDGEGRFDTGDLENVAGLHWVMPDDPNTPLPIEIFMREYYEPRLLTRLLRGETLPPVRSLQSLNRMRPVVRIVDTRITEGRAAEVIVEVERGGEGDARAFDLRLFRDGQLVGTADGELELDPAGKASLRFPGIRLPRESASIGFSAYAFNSDRVKSATARATLAVRPDDAGPGARRAYLVAIGVNDFGDPRWDLMHAAADARRLGAALAKGLAMSGREVVAVTLTGDSRRSHATKETIRAVFDVLAGRASAESLPSDLANSRLLRAASPDDLVIITFSTHGDVSAAGEFRLFPSDIGTAESPRADRFISTSDLWSWLRPVDAGDLVMIIDACYSSAAVGAEFKPGPMGSRGLGELAYEKGMSILASSQPDDVAIESSLLQHGLLTYALTVEGIEARRADSAPSDGRLLLREWLEYGVGRVPELFAELARLQEGGTSAAGTTFVVRRKGPRSAVERSRPQQPTLFDFRRGRDEIAIE